MEYDDFINLCEEYMSGLELSDMKNYVDQLRARIAELEAELAAAREEYKQLYKQYVWISAGEVPPDPRYQLKRDFFPMETAPMSKCEHCEGTGYVDAIPPTGPQDHSGGGE